MYLVKNNPSKRTGLRWVRFQFSSGHWKDHLFQKQVLLQSARNKEMKAVLVNVQRQKIVSRTWQVLKICEESYLQNRFGFSFILILSYFTQIKITAAAITKFTTARNWYKSKIDSPWLLYSQKLIHFCLKFRCRELTYHSKLFLK